MISVYTSVIKDKVDDMKCRYGSATKKMCDAIAKEVFDAFSIGTWVCPNRKCREVFFKWSDCLKHMEDYGHER